MEFVRDCLLAIIFLSSILPVIAVFSFIYGGPEAAQSEIDRAIVIINRTKEAGKSRTASYLVNVVYLELIRNSMIYTLISISIMMASIIILSYL